MADRKMGRPSRSHGSLAEQPKASFARRLILPRQPGLFARVIFLSTILLSILLVAPDRKARAADGNRLAYLDEVNPWYPDTGFPKLVTPQWVGEEGVEAVVVLAIDDMRDPAKYEQYLRPILGRLKAIDGRAPVSIMTCAVKPDDPQLAQWLDEGLSIEIHTVDHPCPLLQGGDFAKAKSTYDRCIDLMHAIPGNKPVAFRTPCCDSLNTVSPRFFAEIFNATTDKGHFLEIDSSVFNLFTAADPEIPRELLFDPDGREKFRKYLPKNLKRGDREFNTFVNWIENYPYPYVIGGTSWEFPCTVPSDWSAQHLQGVNNPDTLRDWKAALDITVLKQGVFCLVFHPHGWIKPEQVVELIDHAEAKHGRKVKFLTFQEAQERVNRNLLKGQPLRDDNGRDGKVRVLDVNADGFMDVVAATPDLRVTRVWEPRRLAWNECETPFPLTQVLHSPAEGDVPARTLEAPMPSEFGVIRPDGHATYATFTFEPDKARSTIRYIVDAWTFGTESWERERRVPRIREPIVPDNWSFSMLRDVDGDGLCEWLIPVYAEGGQPGSELLVFTTDRSTDRLRSVRWKPPEGQPVPVYSGLGTIGDGFRFVDLDENGALDVVYSATSAYGVYLWEDMASGWSRTILSGKRKGENANPIVLPPIGTCLVGDSVRQDNGFFVHSRHLFWQNEDTADELDLVDRVSFDELLKDVRPGPKTPDASLKCVQVPPGFEVELVAAEPLVVDPVAFEWGADGRLWVAEMGDYPSGVEAGEAGGRKEAQKDASESQADLPSGGRVRLLEDTDGDGRYDKSTLFLDGLNFPSGVLPWRKGVLVTAAPEILYAEDSDGDGRADRRVVLFAGFGEGNQQHRVNGLVYGLDNWVYCANGDSDGVIRFENVVPHAPRSQALPGNAGLRGSASRDQSDATQSVSDVRSQAEPGNEREAESGNEIREINISGRDFRFRPDTGEIELVTGRTQFGRSRDDWGNWFGCNNSNPMWHFALEERYLRRNPHLAPPDPKAPVSVKPGPAECFPISREMPRFNDFDRLNRFTSACSVIVYRDELFGPEFAGNSFVSEPVHNLVHREVMEPDGVTFTSRRAASEERSEFLASRDNWFRPTTVKTGPDGALWVADMYRLVIEHPQYIPREQWDEWDLRAGDDRGRIYRVFPRDVGQVSQPDRDDSDGQVKKPAPRLPRLNRLTTAQLVAALDSPNGWQRDTAQRLLVHAQDAAAVPQLRAMAIESERQLARLHALYTLAGLGALEADLLHAAINDPHPGVRRHAVRLAEPFLRESNNTRDSTLGQAVAKLAEDPDPHVRMQVAYTVGEWQQPSAGEALAALALRDAGDVYITTAILSSLNRANFEGVVMAALRSASAAEAAGPFLDRLLDQSWEFADEPTIVRILKTLMERRRDGGHQPWQMTAVARMLESSDRRGIGPAAALKGNSRWHPELRDALHHMLERSRELVARAETATDPELLAAIDLVAVDPGRDPAARIAALGRLLVPRVSATTQAAAVGALARIDDERSPGERSVPAVLLAAWPAFSPQTRSAAIDALLARERWSRRLLAALEDGALPLAGIDAARRQRLLGHRNRSIRERAERVLAGQIDPDRQRVVEAYADAQLAGDAVRGKALFTKACATCHRFEGAGYDVGPDLAALTDKSPEALLVAILDPNRAVESKYVSYTAVTKQGLQHSGLLAAETGNSITLAGPENKRIELLRRDLEELVSSSKSTMPEGLEQDLTAQDVADVIAYVRAGGASPTQRTGQQPGSP